MKLLGYKGNGPGLSGLVDRLIRFRLHGKYSHVEIMFEPKDCVDDYLPDMKSTPINGALWCASSSGMDIIPKYSTKRQGKVGGVRFKRINPSPRKWDIIDLPNKDVVNAVKIFNKYEGHPYDYKLALGYLNFFLRENPDKLICSEVCAKALGFKDAWRYDPCLLMSTIVSQS
jgi:hypothetical protein